MKYQKGKWEQTWEIDESQYLFTREVNALRKSTLRFKERAVQQKRKTEVRDWFITELGLLSGLRVNEMSNLNCGDVHDNRLFPHIKVRNGKGGKSRVVILTPEFLDGWREYVAWKRDVGEPALPTSPVIWSSHSKDRMTTRGIQKAFKRSIRRASLFDYSIHACRHTYGTHLCAKTNIRYAQKMLGHSNVNTTEIYTHLLPDGVLPKISLYGKKQRKRRSYEESIAV